MRERLDGTKEWYRDGHFVRLETTPTNDLAEAPEVGRHPKKR
jgi:hypothetical protein